MLDKNNKYNFTEINTSEDGGRLLMLGIIVFALILYVPYMNKKK